MKSTVILTGLLVIAATSIFAGCGSNRANSTVQKYAATGTLTVVPEPSTYALLFASAGMMFWVIRRKRMQNA